MNNNSLVMGGWMWPSQTKQYNSLTISPLLPLCPISSWQFEIKLDRWNQRPVNVGLGVTRNFVRTKSCEEWNLSDEIWNEQMHELQLH